MNLQIKRFLIYMINWIFIFKVSLNIMVFFLKKYIYLSIDESKFTKKKYQYQPPTTLAYHTPATWLEKIKQITKIKRLIDYSRHKL